MNRRLSPGRAAARAALAATIAGLTATCSVLERALVAGAGTAFPPHVGLNLHETLRVLNHELGYVRSCRRELR